MKRLIGMAVVTWIGIVLACSGTGLAQTPAPYVFGFTLDLTGMRADISIGPKRSAQIRIDEINGMGGVNNRPLKAIYYDGESDPVKNVKNVKRIIDIDKAITCMGFFSC